MSFRIALSAYLALFISTTHAAANIYNTADAQRFFILMENAVHISGDLKDSFAGLPVSDELATDCVYELSGDMGEIIDELSEGQDLLEISAGMINENDEALAVSVTRQYLDTMIRFTQMERKIINRLLGRCYRIALVVAKGQDIIQTLDQIDASVRSLKDR
jgi:hypothetical protein